MLTKYIYFLGQERDPTPPLKPSSFQQEVEDILDIDADFSSMERRKSCELPSSKMLFLYLTKVTSTLIVIVGMI